MYIYIYICIYVYIYDLLFLLIYSTTRLASASVRAASVSLEHQQTPKCQYFTILLMFKKNDSIWKKKNATTRFEMNI